MYILCIYATNAAHSVTLCPHTVSSRSDVVVVGAPWPRVVWPCLCALPSVKYTTTTTTAAAAALYFLTPSPCPSSSSSPSPSPPPTALRAPLSGEYRQPPLLLTYFLSSFIPTPQRLCVCLFVFPFSVFVLLHIFSSSSSSSYSPPRRRGEDNKQPCPPRYFTPVFHRRRHRRRHHCQ